jgi:glycogen(starch) synthase
MRILMFGWEFPPLMSGGLGTACFGMTRALAALDHEITFVLPRAGGKAEPTHVRLVPASGMAAPEPGLEEPFVFQGLSIRSVDSMLRPYLSKSRYPSLLSGPPGSRFIAISGDYGADLISEAVRYGRVAGAIAGEHPCDVIHAHDWMTVFAGIEARRISGRPLILHIHALEFDRSGENINQDIYDIERFGLEVADHVIAVSHFTKNIMIERYGIDPGKVTVVHNAVTRREAGAIRRIEKDSGWKTVLFLGRITFQKGPDYFVDAAARVLREMPEATFIMAGAGDMMTQMVERVATLGIGSRFHFTGFLQGDDVERALTMSDLYVMPSVSEPFGISPLEAMLCDVPVIISRQSGVSEVLRHALQVDFWDVEELANKIVAVLKHPPLAAEMVKASRDELRHIRWEHSAGKILNVYETCLDRKES